MVVEAESMMAAASGSMSKQRFDDAAELTLDTNLFAIECRVAVPIHVLFQDRGQLPRDKFLSLWKSISPQKETKLPVVKAQSRDMEQLRTLLDVHKMFFIHHRVIPNKGNILYYSTMIDEQILLTEISIATSGKGTVVVRSNDEYRSVLCVHGVRRLIDAKAPKSNAI